MQTTLTAIELTATINNSRQIEFDEDLPSDIASKVRVIVLYEPNSDGFSEREWLETAARNSVYDFPSNDAEDIYTLEDGRQLSDEI